MTIFAERGPASKVLGSFSYKNALRVLPVEDLLHTDDGMTVRHAREALNATAKILNALLHNAPAGYPAEVRRELRNVMFHVRTALAQLDAYIGAGYYQDDSIDKVPGVESGIYNHLQALKGAKRQWGIWMALEKQEKKQGLKGFEELTGNTMASDISGEVGYSYFGYEEDDATDAPMDGFLEDTLAQLAPKESKSIWPTVGVGLASFAALAGLYLWRGRK